MSIVVQNLRLPLEARDEDAVAQAQKRLKQKAKGYVLKKAVDCRRREITFVYSVAFDGLPEEEKWVARLADPDVTVKSSQPLELHPGDQAMDGRPVICGFGPAGMFAALLLARHGYRPLVFEGGSQVEQRVQKITRYWETGELDPECNVQFGEGGAGTFSDGKLTTRIGDSRCRWVLEELHRFGAPEEILYLAKPHIGTDHLRSVVRSIRQEIQRLGGEIHFDDRVEEILLRNGRAVGVRTAKSGTVEEGPVVLAIGHSARSTYEMLLQKGFAIQPKPFSVGVRTEHLQREMDRMVYGRYAGHPNLRPAEYQLSHRVGQRACYSFCMCPGGTVVAAASETGSICVNGMSEFARDGVNCNSAIVASVEPEDFPGNHPLRGMYFQRELEKAAWMLGKGGAPIQRLGDFRDGHAANALGKVKPSYTGKTTAGDLSGLFPSQVRELLLQGFARFDSRLKGFSQGDTLLTAVETRTSAPVRISRGEDLQSTAVENVYPCGEGCGYAGGIMSAAVDGIRVASQIISRYAPLV
ncbi:MAG: NAD(P)/FAD-dependent oxidoreductase [Eubacteriales bacterium]|jgi:uncharacterized FAD-dependent dehydrogenase